MIKFSISETHIQKHKSSRYRLNPNVHVILVKDGTSRILNLDGFFIALPVISTLMLKLILQYEFSVVVNKLADQFKTDQFRISKDLSVFLKKLEALKVITKSPAKQIIKLSYLLQCFLEITVPLTTEIPNKLIQHKVLLLLAWCSFKLFGWNKTVNSWKQYFYNQTVSPTKSVSVLKISEEIQVAVSRHFIKMDCKEKAIVCWAICQKEGIPASLVLGINLYPLSSHFWCEFEGNSLTDNKERCNRFFPLIMY